MKSKLYKALARKFGVDIANSLYRTDWYDFSMSYLANAKPAYDFNEIKIIESLQHPFFNSLTNNSTEEARDILKAAGIDCSLKD